MATLIDELVLESWLDDWGSCYKPHYPTGGQWLPYWGRGMVKTTYLPLPFALKERSWVQTLRPSKIFDTHLFLKGKCFTLMITSLTNLPSVLFCLETQLETSFLSSFSHIFLQSYGEKHNFTSSLLILLYYPVHRALVKGLKPLLMRSWYTSIHNSQLLLVALLSSCLDPVLYKQQSEVISI